MEKGDDNLINELTSRQIKPSYHRVRVLQYLTENRNHPTVDQIFLDLRKELPTLSKTTIYNTLNLFVEAKLVRQFTFAENEAQYDLVLDEHGHFKCEICGILYDFQININDSDAEGLDGFKIAEKNVYFQGVCKGCLKIKSKN